MFDDYVTDLEFSPITTFAELWRRDDTVGCYDRDGQPISFTRYMQLWRSHYGEDDWYARIARDDLENAFEVSTVWLGRDHQRGDGPPLIFESMVFTQDRDRCGSHAFDTRRYTTEEEARAGHTELCRRWSNIGWAEGERLLQEAEL